MFRFTIRELVLVTVRDERVQGRKGRDAKVSGTGKTVRLCGSWHLLSPSIDRREPVPIG